MSPPPPADGLGDLGGREGRRGTAGREGTSAVGASVGAIMDGEDSRRFAMTFSSSFANWGRAAPMGLRGGVDESEEDGRRGERRLDAGGLGGGGGGCEGVASEEMEGRAGRTGGDF